MYPNHPPQPSDADRERAGFFRAGKVAAWVWVVLTVLPVLAVLACCGLCAFGGTLGAVLPGVAPSPTP